jgi:hypothetical protein
LVQAAVSQGSPFDLSILFSISEVWVAIQ